MTEEKQTYKYFAFISYKSDDVKWAAWLQRKLERYSLPSVLQHKDSSLPRHLKPVFRDGTDIGLGELKPEINNNLRNSRYLIVLCSPRSAVSPWVGSEIEQFCKLGRRDHIIALIIDGTPYSDDPQTECYHPKLREYFPKGDTTDTDMQLLGADIHAATSSGSFYKKEHAFIQVVATMLRLPVDELWNRRQRFLRTKITAALLACIAILAAFWAVWMMSRPFDMTLTLIEPAGLNTQLPCEGGEVRLVIEGKEFYAFTSIDTCRTFVFYDIPAKYKRKPATLIFRKYGYYAKDTTVMLASDMTLDIERDSTFAIYAGTVTDEDADPLADVEVSILDHQTKTGADGTFSITLPVSQQRQLQTVTWRKPGYVTDSMELQPQPDHSLVMSKE